MMYCEGPAVPHTLLYSLIEEEFVYNIQNHTDLEELSNSMAWPQMRDFRVQLDNGFIARVSEREGEEEGSRGEGTDCVREGDTGGSQKSGRSR